MKKVNEFKISLMEKPKDFLVDEEGKGNYIIRSSGVFKVEEYLQNLDEDQQVSEDEYEKFLQGAMMAIYDNLLENNAEKSFDTVGLWITYKDGEILENAMDFSVLETFNEFGPDEVVPFLEFVKMTLPVNESEVS